MADTAEDGSVRCSHCGEPHPLSFSHCPKTGRSLTSGEALVGRVIADRFRIVGLLGEGGMGAVYVAEHTLIGRKVALKRLHPELAQDEKAVARFQREARAAAATGHENIVEILDLGYAEDGAPFLVMEYLKGRSLAQTLHREGRLAPSRACHIVGQVLAALSAVHENGIVHRDLKPDNVFLTRRDGRGDYVKVLDFGVSKVRRDDEEGMDLTRTGVMLGTPYYMSPEQARGMKDLDHRVDLYAIGTILYECLSGDLPYSGDNYHALLSQILTGSAPPLGEMAPDVPERLVAVVERAMATNRDDRFASADLFRQALVPFGAPPLDGEPAGAPAAITESRIAYAATSRASRPAPRGGRFADTTPADAPASSRYPIVAEEDEVGRSLRALPKPSQRTGPPRRFVASSSDWVDEPQSEPASPSFVPPINPAPTVTPVSFRVSTPAFGSVAPQPSPTQIKGALLLAALDHLHTAHGADGRDRALAGLPIQVRARISGVLLPVAWFPIETYHELLEAAERVLGASDGSIARAIGDATAARDLPTTHRLFLQSATPLTAVARIPKLFRTYHNRGEAIVERIGEGDYRVELRDIDPESRFHAVALTAFFGRLLILSGAKGVRASLLSSRGRGDDKTLSSLRFG